MSDIEDIFKRLLRLPTLPYALGDRSNTVNLGGNGGAKISERSLPDYGSRRIYAALARSLRQEKYDEARGLISKLFEMDLPRRPEHLTHEGMFEYLCALDQDRLSEIEKQIDVYETLAEEADSRFFYAGGVTFSAEMKLNRLIKRGEHLSYFLLFCINFF